MRLKLSDSVMVFLKLMPVRFELKAMNFGDSLQEYNKDTKAKNKINFLMIYIITISILIN